jgi:hypothetical protein
MINRQCLAFLHNIGRVVGIGRRCADCFVSGIFRTGSVLRIIMQCF